MLAIRSPASRAVQESIWIAAYFVSRKAREMPKLRLIFWNRLRQGGEEKGKQIDPLDPSAHFLGKLPCETVVVPSAFPFATRTSHIICRGANLAARERFVSIPRSKRGTCNSSLREIAPADYSGTVC